MFKNRTAWFSNSVRTGIPQFWLCEGGTLACQKTADYLFSADATCPDTQRIFASEAYIKDKVTVFHSLYLSACEKCHSVKSVCIGHYVLPPAPVQDEVRAVFGRFIWEHEDFKTAESPQDQLALPNQKEEDNLSESGIKYTCSDVATGTNLLRDPRLCCAVQNYPVNNMITGYVSIDELKGYPGELHDFIPGHFGSSVTRVHSTRPGGASEHQSAEPRGCRAIGSQQRHNHIL
ncbi:telomere repeats-binding bouquet formation protein 2 [Osmerus eperlanus]|uniref:telomere repeats-binding bouquet formation protein 2 n=1 Tax=Osmerus eperlanus TaxID=29151 RepID=UPI002E11DFD0